MGGIKAILQNPRSLSIDKRKAIFQLAEIILKNFKIITNESEVYIYFDGAYKPNGEDTITKYIRNVLHFREEILQKDINEIMSYIKAKTSIEEINEPENLICLRNGILNIDTMKLEPHTPEKIFLNKLPVDYNPKAKCPNIINFLLEVVEKRSIPTLQEYIGYLLLKNQKFRKAVMLYGTGGNGKSVFVNLLKAFLGEGNYVSIPLQALEDRPFILNELRGKLANLFADLPDTAIKETSYFKSLTGTDSISVEKKFVQKIFSFKSYAKMVFSANQIPRPTKDMTDAFFSRWIVAIFPKTFKKNANPNLIEKLTTENELSGFLNFAIEGLKRLLGRKYFFDRKFEETKRLFLKYSDSVLSFVEDRIEESPDEYELKEPLYSAYTQYCRQNKMIPKSNNAFHRELRKAVYVEDYKPKVLGKQQHAWKGIKLVKRKRKVESELSRKEQKKLRKYLRKLVKFSSYQYEQNPLISGSEGGTSTNLKYTLSIDFNRFIEISTLSMISLFNRNYLKKYKGKKKKLGYHGYNTNLVRIYKNKHKPPLDLTQQVLSDLKQWEQPNEPGVVSAEIIFSNPNLLGWAEDKLNHFNNMVKEGIFREVRSGFYFSEALRDFAPDSEATSEENEGKKEV